MEKETFIKLINLILSYEKEVDKLNELKICWVDSTIGNIHYDIVYLFFKTFFDQDRIDDIYWWLYECEKSDKIEMWNSDGSPIPTKTPDDLWNLLTGFND